MENNIFFSVIVPTYNRAGFLGKTIQSVLSQRFRKLELLIIDDGSSDRTEEVVRSFHDDRIQYFKKENGERAAARNFGIQKAIGSYITFLDSDDLFHVDHLEVAMSCVLENQPSIFHLGYNVVDNSGKILQRWKKLDNPINARLIEGNFLSCLGVFIKREILAQHRFVEDRDLAGSEDYELWLRLAARYPIYTISQVTASLVNHDARSVISFEPARLITRIEKLVNFIQRDEVFMNIYGAKLKQFHSYLDIYVALHLALLPSSKRLAFKTWLHSFVKFPKIISNRRFWIVLKKIGLS
ncbi:MAG: glycosyltransferase family 2 protein [Bacteroidia bacterium]